MSDTSQSLPQEWCEPRRLTASATVADSNHFSSTKRTQTQVRPHAPQHVTDKDGNHVNVRGNKPEERDAMDSLMDDELMRQRQEQVNTTNL